MPVQLLKIITRHTTIQNARYILKKGNEHQSIRPDKARMLELLDQEFKMTMTIMLKA